MTSPVLLYTTWPDADEAEAAGRRLINEHLAGCINILPQVRSVWKDAGDVHTSAEVVMIVKTIAEKAAAVEARVRELHPYDIPAVIALATREEGTSQAWTAWLDGVIKA